MAASETDRYDAFVKRSFRELQVGLALDNGHEGSLKGRVCAALKKRTRADEESHRSPAEKVIDGRFILGGDDASYLASGLAMLWSTVGEPPKDSKDGHELSLAPAALYSPDAVNGIHRGLVAAMEKRNRDMRDEAPSALGNLMRALLPLLPFLDLGAGEAATRDFLNAGKVSSVDERNRLFRLLVDTRKKLDADRDGDRRIPSSSLTSKILEQATKGHEAALREQRVAAEQELFEVTQKSAAQMRQLKKLVKLLRNKRDAVETLLKATQRANAERLAESQLREQELEAEVADRKAQHDKATRDLATLAAQRNQLATSQEQLKASVKALQGKVTAKNREAEAATAQAAKLQKQLGDATTSQEKLKERVKALRMKVNDTQTAAGAAELAAEAAAVAAAAAATATLQREVAEMDATITRLNQELAASREELARMQTKARADEESIRMLTKKVGDLEAAAQKDNEQLALRTLALTRARQQLAAAQERDAATIAARETQIANLNAQVDALQASVTAAQNRESAWAAQTQAQLDAQQEQHADALNEQAEKWKEDIAQAELEAKEKAEAAASESVQKADAERKEATKKAKAQVTQALRDVEAADEKLKACQAENAELKKNQSPEAQLNLQSLQEQLADVAADNVAKQQELDAANAALKVCKEKLVACEADKKVADAVTMQALDQATTQETQLKAKQAEVEQLQAQLNAAQTADATSQAKLQADLDAAKAELKKCEEVREACQADLAKAQLSENALTAKADALSAELAACNEKIEAAEAACQANTTELQARTQQLKKETTLLKELHALYDKRDKRLAELVLLNAELERTAFTIAGGVQNDPQIEADADEAKKDIAAADLRIREISDELQAMGVDPPPAAPVPTVGYNGVTNNQAPATYDPFDPNQPPTQASGGDAWINTAIFRGLVGQRGPTEPASVALCPQDAQLPYALPDVKQVVKHLLPAHLLLQSTPDPTAADLERAMGACAACSHADKRQRLSSDVASPATTSEALALFEDDFAITGEAPAAELPAERCGVELPHEVRWMPRGPRARTMARVAVMEHAIARCAQIAAKPDVRPDVAAALRHAGAALKLQQLAPLYELCAAVENDDEPHPLGTNGRRLVTRPCAVVRGTLSFPVDLGVAPLTEAHASNAKDKPLTQDASLAQAIGKTAAQTAAMRNNLRKRGLSHNVYVAPATHELAFRSAPTGAIASARLDILRAAINYATITQARARAVENPTDELTRLANVLVRLRTHAEGVANNPGASNDNEAEQLVAPLFAAVADVRGALDAAPVAAAAPAQPLEPEGPATPTEPPPGWQEERPRTNDRAPTELYRDETFVRIINRLIVAAAALEFEAGDGEPTDPVAAFLEANNPVTGGEGYVTPQTRREGLWNEMHRYAAISQDRLWVFVRLMSGKIGGNVSEVITLADEATLKAAKAIQEQRLEVSRRVSDTQAKIVETVVASMLKNSRMTMEYVQEDDDKKLAVIDAEARKELKDLQTGASGRPFFEANVALKNLTQPNQAPPKLQDVLSGLAEVGVQMQSTLERTLAEPGAASASLIELSHPSNSYFVSMRADAVAAIREAQEKLNCELGALGGTRRLMLWELVEGGCTVLVQRFAELCGYLLVQARTSTGVSAMYVSHQNIYTNASQARISLAKLTAAACEYIARVPAPKFDSDDPKTARFAVITNGEKVRDIDVTARRVPVHVAALRGPVSASGWWNEGGRRR